MPASLASSPAEDLTAQSVAEYLNRLDRTSAVPASVRIGRTTYYGASFAQVRDRTRSSYTLFGPVWHGTVPTGETYVHHGIMLAGDLPASYLNGSARAGYVDRDAEAGIEDHYCVGSWWAPGEFAPVSMTRDADGTTRPTTLADVKGYHYDDGDTPTFTLMPGSPMNRYGEPYAVEPMRATVELAPLADGWTEVEMDGVTYRVPASGAETGAWADLADVPSDDHARAYLLQDGNLSVPGGRYGRDTQDCAEVALALFQCMRDGGADANYYSLNSDMSAVVNSSDGVAEVIRDSEHVLGAARIGELLEGEDLVPDDDPNLAEMIRGYVTAATWTDLQRACPTCDGSGKVEDDPSGSDTWSACKACEGSGGAQESGSSPGEFGMDDLSSEARESISADVADFYRGNFADVRAYADACYSGERVSFDPGEGTAYDYCGHDLYLTAAGHGAGFWDRGLGELGDRLTAASEPHTVPDLYLIDGEITS